MRGTQFLFYILLLCACISLRAQNKNDINQKLLQAAYDGDASMVSRLIADSADVNATNGDGITSLMYASEKGYSEIVKILLYNNADPNLKPSDGRTALISAAMHNSQDIVYLLLIYGADINAQDEYGATALIYASAMNLSAMVNYLLTNGAQHVMKAQDGTDALMTAAYFGNTEIIALLCDHNADINTTDYKGFTPFTIAVQNNNLNLADSLIKHQSDLKTHFRDYPKMTMVDYARIFNRKKIVRKLKHDGLHGSFWPFFNKITLNYNLATFNTGDFFMGGGIGLFDSKYNISLELGMTGRLARKRILEKITDNEYYQLWEKRKCIYLGAEKLFNFGTKNIERRQGIFISAKGIFTYGSYEGLERKPKRHFAFAPGLGYCYMFKTIFLKAAYEYCDLGIYRGMNHWITVTAGISINTSKNRLYKKIYWI